MQQIIKKTLKGIIICLIALLIIPSQFAVSKSIEKEEYIIVTKEGEVSTKTITERQARELTKDEDISCVEVDEKIDCEEKTEIETMPLNNNWAMKMINYKRDSYNGEGLELQ